MSRDLQGLLWGLLGTLAFSLTLPAIRIATPELGVGFVSIGRAVVAGVLAMALLAAMRQPIPNRRDLLKLAGSGLGVVIGFPLLTTLALAEVESSHGAIVVGLLPLSTAIAAVLLTGERPGVRFWLASAAGTALLLVYVLAGSGAQPQLADLALVGAVMSAAVGYALGGQLAATLGGWQVICWALAILWPVVAGLAVLFVELPERPVSWEAWTSFAYVALVSQFLGFFAWYRGLALGGIARVGQTQLLQLFFTLIASAVLLGETLDPTSLVFAIAIVVCVLAATRTRAAPATATAVPGGVGDGPGGSRS